MVEVEPSPTQKEAKPFLDPPLPVPCHYSFATPSIPIFTSFCLLKKLMVLGMVIHAYNPHAVEAEAGGSAKLLSETFLRNVNGWHCTKANVFPMCIRAT